MTVSFSGYSRNLKLNPIEPGLVWDEPDHIQTGYCQLSDTTPYDIRDDDIDVQLPLFPELTDA